MTNDTDFDLARVAHTSLYYAAMYAAATGHQDAVLASELLTEQELLLDRISTAGLTPYVIEDSPTMRRDWLDANIDRLDLSHPMLARYADLHHRRMEFLPTQH